MWHSIKVMLPNYTPVMVKLHFFHPRYISHPYPYDDLHVLILCKSLISFHQDSMPHLIAQYISCSAMHCFSYQLFPLYRPEALSR